MTSEVWLLQSSAGGWEGDGPGSVLAVCYSQADAFAALREYAEATDRLRRRVVDIELTETWDNGERRYWVQPQGDGLWISGPYEPRTLLYLHSEEVGYMLQRKRTEARSRIRGD